MNKDTAVRSFLESFFGKKDEELLKLIDEISIFKKISRREILFFEGDEGSCVYFLASGRVKLFKATDEGKEAIIKFVSAGEIFAEILLQLKSRYPVNAESMEKCELLCIDAQRLYKAIQARPDMAMQLIGMLSFRIKYLLGMVEQLALTDVRARFENYLKTLHNKCGGNTITLPAPKGEIALLLGTTAETFSRILRKLTDEGVIEVNNRTITLLEEL